MCLENIVTISFKTLTSHRYMIHFEENKLLIEKNKKTKREYRGEVPEVFSILFFMKLICTPLGYTREMVAEEI